MYANAAFDCTTNNLIITMETENLSEITFK